VGLARHGTVRRLRQVSRYANPVAGVLRIIAGAYITWFWALNLRSGAGATGATGRFVETISQRAVQFTGDNWPIIGTVLAAVVVAAVLRLLLRPPEARETGPSRTQVAAQPEEDT
jgi:hypothetical protein